MQKSLLFVAVIALFIALASASSMVGSQFADYSSYTYEQFKTDYSRPSGELDASEDAFRRIVFDANMHKILKHNLNYVRGKVSWWMKPTRFTDRTQEEFTASFGYNSMSAKASRAHMTIFQQPSSLVVANSINKYAIDWSKNMPDVQNQGQCGSCWANAAAEAISGRMSVELGMSPAMVSRQQITSCTPNPNKCGGTGGCSGATAQLGFDYVKAAGGIALEADYPYSSGDGDSGVCQDAQHKSQFAFQLGGYHQVIPNNKTDLLVALQSGPVAISVAAASWSFYGGGVYTGCSSSGDYELDHAVVLLGYGQDATTQQNYYTVRNSWGPEWGENGNIRVYASPDNVDEKCGTDDSPFDGSACANDPNPRTLACGECGILYDSAYPQHITVIH